MVVGVFLYMVGDMLDDTTTVDCRWHLMFEACEVESHHVLAWGPRSMGVVAHNESAVILGSVYNVAISAMALCVVSMCACVCLIVGCASMVVEMVSVVV